MEVKELERWKGSTPVRVVVELAADTDAPSGFSNVCSCPSLVVGSVSLSLSRVAGPYLPIQLRRRGVESDMMEEGGWRAGAGEALTSVTAASPDNACWN